MPLARPLRVAAALGALATSPSPVAAQGVAPLADSTARRVDSVVTAYMSARGVPGLALAIAVGDRIVWSRGYGLADLENAVPVTTRSLFRTASIGKPMTATAALQLWQAGKLDLDAPVQRYCPAFPAKRWPVTTRHLLSHTAGLRDKTAEEETNYRHYPDVVSSLAPFARDSLLSPPGTAWRYTSYGYNVVGCAIEGASGLPYAEYMARHVFAPAGMRHTRVDDPRAIVPGRVRGYARDSAGALRNSVHDDMSNRLPAGGFVSTPDDLLRFATSLFGGRLLADSALRVMVRPHVGADGGPVGGGAVGLGWALGEWHGVREVMHGGGTPQVSGFLYLLPAKRFAAAFLMNLEGASDRGDLAGDLAKVVLGRDAPHR
jgi:serine beta-lactamase-like protein LACTB, mitochondrial